MQIFFWLSIVVLAFATFSYLTLPMVLNIGIHADVKPPKSYLKPSTILYAIILALGSVGLYSYIGNPALLATVKTPKIDSKYIAIIEQIEAHLAQNPQDADGWQVVAPTYLSLNQPEKAFDAFANAIKFGNSNGKNWLGLGKANLQVSNGVFGPMTKVAFTKAHEKLPDDVESMFFYASMLQNIGDLAEAKQALMAFIAAHDYTAEQLQPLQQILATLNQAEARQ